MGNSSRPSDRRASCLLFGLAAAALALLVPRPASGLTCLWDGSANTAWTNANNWSTCNSTTPQPGDTVTINSGGNQPTLSSGSATVGQITIASGATLTVGSGGALTLSNGLTGAGNLTVASGGTVNWNAGIMGGAGTTTIQAGGTLSLSSSYGQLERTLNNAGTTNISSNAYIYIITTGIYNNSGTANLLGDYYCLYGDGTTTVTNTGTFNRMTGGATATIYQVKFVNSGNVNVQTGTLSFSTVQASTHTGDFTISPGATLQFAGSASNTFNGDITGTGSAVASFTGGTQTLNGAYTVPSTTIAGATVNFNQASTVTLSNLTMGGGTLAGSANISVTNNADLNSGNLKGSGTFTLAAGPDATLDSSYIQVERSFVNARTITILGNAYFYMIGTGTFTNQAAGVVDIQGDYYPLYGDGTSTATNNGSITRTASSGIATIYQIKFTNTSPGTVSVQSGTLDIQSTGSTSNGAFSVSGGATLKFTGSGTNTITGPITGAGNVSFGGGGAYNLSGTFGISNTTITGGTINFNQASALSFTNFRMDSGTLAGSAAVSVTNSADLNSGTLAGSGTFTLAAGSTTTMDSSYINVQRKVRNSGTITQQAGSYFYVTGSGSFDNQAAGVVDIQNDNYGWYGDGATNLTNAGTINRTTSSGNASITSMKTTNTGTINPQSGTLTFSGGTFTQTGGAIHLSGGNLAASGVTLNIQGGVVDGNGNIAGNVNVSGGQFSPGTSPGEIAITGTNTYTQAAPGILKIEINGPDPGFDYDDVLVGGAANLGGELNIHLGFTPTVGQSFTILQHASRTGNFASITGDTPGAGRGWDISYSATETKLTVANEIATLMNVDSRDAAGTSSDHNGVLEPGERVVVEPSWTNMTENPITATGTASALTGPTASGVTYTLNDANADYGTTNANSVNNCFDATGNCYQVQIAGGTSRPEARPAVHWDATFQENVTGGATKTWKLHVGDSFTDVPRTQLFYRRIETLLHTGITTGCTATEYCPSQAVSRGQMAIFVARGLAGGSANVPVSGVVNTGIPPTPKPYNCVAGATGASIFSDVFPTDIYCRHVHYIAAQNVTLGCSATQYCPGGTITRIEMAAFIAKAVVAPLGGTAVPLAYGPDPVTTFSYNCNGSNIHFSDVPASNAFCKHVHFLWARGIVSGVTPTTFKPADVVTRDGMARFLSNAFNLLLYGPIP